ncbi:MAG: alpha/beta fold hydrolase [Acetobacterales bacterium]
MLLPGLLCDAQLWAHQQHALADIADSRVIDLTRSDSIADLADDVLAEAPPRFALAGLSMGGYVALEVVRRAPERVSALCLADTSARADTPEQIRRRRGLIELAEKGRFRGVTPKLLPLLIHPDRQDDEALTEVVMSMAERVGKDAFLRQQRAIMGRVDQLGHVRGIRCPTVVLCGRQDALTPPELSEELAAGIPGAKLRLFDDCGHLSALERPQAVSEAMRDWLLA